ncbi:MAG: hypothetical protein KKA70_15215 [Proteobacteria bacterium]|nr:hypothetical protein [Pseudomonadota bacterium]
MTNQKKVPVKSFCMFGFSKSPVSSLKERLNNRLGISIKVLSYGEYGNIFFHSSCGDIAENETDLVIKLGFIRSKDRVPVSSKGILNGKFTFQNECDHTKIRGNALLASFSKIHPQFSVYKTLISPMQCYYWTDGDDLICSDNLRCLVAAIDNPEIDQRIIPFHFIYRHAPGDLTYYKNIKRLLPGQLFKFDQGKIRLSLIQNFRFEYKNESSNNLVGDVQQLNKIITEVVHSYLVDIDNRNSSSGNLLSGGVDSSLLQLAINEKTGSKPRSFSYALVNTPCFEFEINYAKQASALLETDHTFVEVTPEEYPALIVGAIEALGQPVILDVGPSMLAISQYLADNFANTRYFFCGQGADTLFGLDIAKKIKIIEMAKRIPGGVDLMLWGGKLLRPFLSVGQTLVKGANIIKNSDDADYFFAPHNTIAVYHNLSIARRCFGDDIIKQVFLYRRELEEMYLNSNDYTEKVHTIDLLSDTYEIGVQNSQLFMANDKEQIYPFMDQDIIEASFSINSRGRYINHLQVKPWLKQILNNKGLSQIYKKPKGGSVFTADLYKWMKEGPLKEMVMEIDIPSFLTKKDYDKLVEKPDKFLWALLTFDIFKKKLVDFK